MKFNKKMFRLSLLAGIPLVAIPSISSACLYKIDPRLEAIVARSRKFDWYKMPTFEQVNNQTATEGQKFISNNIIKDAYFLVREDNFTNLEWRFNVFDNTRFQELNVTKEQFKEVIKYYFKDSTLLFSSMLNFNKVFEKNNTGFLKQVISYDNVKYRDKIPNYWFDQMDAIFNNISKDFTTRYSEFLDYLIENNFTIDEELNRNSQDLPPRKTSNGLLFAFPVINYIKHYDLSYDKNSKTTLFITEKPIAETDSLFKKFIKDPKKFLEDSEYNENSLVDESKLRPIQQEEIDSQKKDILNMGVYQTDLLRMTGIITNVLENEKVMPTLAYDKTNKKLKFLLEVQDSKTKQWVVYDLIGDYNNRKSNKESTITPMSKLPDDWGYEAPASMSEITNINTYAYDEMYGKDHILSLINFFNEVANVK